MADQFSLILLPTLKCNAACDYCFETKTDDRLTLERLSILIAQVLEYMRQNALHRLAIHWQGGEVMTLPPQWFEQAYEMIESAAAAGNIRISNYLQSNMIGYHRKWNPVIARMFGNSIGSSLDFPNLHRRFIGRGPEKYNALWSRKVREARQAGIQVQVISIPNRETLKLGAERFYEYFVEEMQITDFQVNTPFPGGPANAAKEDFSLATEDLSRFMLDLAALWLERGYGRGVCIGPFDELLNYFIDGHACLPCIWRENCAQEFVCIDARGDVSQCDCWVTSYPDYRFGNLFTGAGLAELMRTSAARRRFQQRPQALMQKGDCIDCDYLALCHGGCPVRTYTVHGDLFEKDPYCRLYQALFRRLEQAAAQLALARIDRPPGRCPA